VNKSLLPRPISVWALAAWTPLWLPGDPRYPTPPGSDPHESAGMFTPDPCGQVGEFEGIETIEEDLAPFV